VQRKKALHGYRRRRMNKTGIYCCNGCGKKIKTEQDIVLEGVLQVETTWGYFSRKDGETHSFTLCEECYDQIIKKFAVPAAVEE
jgi:hypothetical protein